jgi:hypothetical protein
LMFFILKLLVSNGLVSQIGSLCNLVIRLFFYNYYLTIEIKAYLFSFLLSFNV